MKVGLGGCSSVHSPGFPQMPLQLLLLGGSLWKAVSSLRLMDEVLSVLQQEDPLLAGR